MDGDRRKWQRASLCAVVVALRSVSESRLPGANCNTFPTFPATMSLAKCIQHLLPALALSSPPDLVLYFSRADFSWCAS